MIPCHPSDVAPFDTPEVLHARLTDSIPVVLQICAWHEDVSTPRNKGANHILCAECAERMMQEVA